MPTLRPLLKLLLLPLLAWLAADNTASAQVFGFGPLELYNGSRPGVYVPFDGAGYSHRYNYLDVPFFYVGPVGMNADYARYHLNLMIDLDRQERAFRMAGHLKSFDRVGPLLPPDRPPLSERLREKLYRWR
jgi:hypothetical protein